METASAATPPTPSGAAFALVAEADGNRTRRRRDTPPTGFEDRGGHQAPGRLRGRRYSRRAAARHPACGACSREVMATVEPTRWPPNPEVPVTLGGDGARTPYFETVWSRRYRANRTKLASGDIGKVAQVIRDLSRIDKERGLSAGERRMLARARQIIGGSAEP